MEWTDDPDDTDKLLVRFTTPEGFLRREYPLLSFMGVIGVQCNPTQVLTDIVTIPPASYPPVEVLLAHLPSRSDVNVCQVRLLTLLTCQANAS